MPSTFVGRPSWLSTTSPTVRPLHSSPVAKCSGTPGVSPSGGCE
ncbi:hypothetical protein [Corallococcus sp. 4LFB]